MFVTELELGGWPPGRRRSLARGAPSSPTCSWSSTAAGHQVSGDRQRGRGWPPGRRRLPTRPSPPACSWSRHTRRIAGASELAGMLLAELEFSGWSPGRRRRSPARRAKPRHRPRALLGSHCPVVCQLDHVILNGALGRPPAMPPRLDFPPPESHSPVPAKHLIGGKPMG
jgi:hypothetical protein